MIAGGLEVSINVSLYASVQNWIHEMCGEAVRIERIHWNLYLNTLRPTKCMMKQFA